MRSDFSMALVAVTAACAGAAEVENYGFGVRGGPPAEVVYSFGSRLHGEGRRYGDLDTVQFHATYVESLRASDNFDLLLGADWRRVQASVPSGAPVPDTLQSAALVLGFDWRINNRWAGRVEVLPGIYSDFEDVRGRDFNAPFSVEVTHKFSDSLTVGVQANVDARRETPVVAFPVVRWKISERWSLNATIPRPQLECHAADFATLFAGAQFGGGTYAVADDFGRRRRVRRLDAEVVDFQEIRAGAGVRVAIATKLTAEISGGWTFDRRYNFHDRNYELKTDGAPFVEAGLAFAF